MDEELESEVMAIDINTEAVFPVYLRDLEENLRKSPGHVKAQFP